MIKTQFACTQLFWKFKVLLGITPRNFPFLNWSGITHICNLVRVRKNWIFFFRFYLLTEPNGLMAKSWVSIGLNEAVCCMTICWRGGMEKPNHIYIESHFSIFFGYDLKAVDTGQVHCAWLIKWVVKREKIQLVILAGTWWYWVSIIVGT